MDGWNKEVGKFYLAKIELCKHCEGSGELFDMLGHPKRCYWCDRSGKKVIWVLLEDALGEIKDK